MRRKCLRRGERRKDTLELWKKKFKQVNTFQKSVTRLYMVRIRRPVRPTHPPLQDSSSFLLTLALSLSLTVE